MKRSASAACVFILALAALLPLLGIGLSDPIFFKAISIPALSLSLGKLVRCRSNARFLKTCFILFVSFFLVGDLLTIASLVDSGGFTASRFFNTMRFCYRIALIFVAAGMIAGFEKRSLKSILVQPTTLLGLSVSIPFVGKFLALFASSDHISTAQLLSESAGSFITIILLTLSITTFCSTKNIKWVALCCGLMFCLVAGWGKRAEALTFVQNGSTAVYEFIWLMGVLIISQGILSEVSFSRIPKFSHHSLISMSKLVLLTVVFATILFFTLVGVKEEGVARFITTTVSLGIALTVFFSFYIEKKLANFSDNVKALVETKFSDSALPVHARLPDELNEGFIALLQNKKEELVEKQKQQTLVQVAQKQEQIARQVAHDIRSPLAALDMTLKHSAQLPEESRILVRSAVSRIRDIANGLLQKYHTDRSQVSDNPSSADTPRSEMLLFGLMDNLISEKRTQYRSKIGIEIDLVFGESAYGIFASINATEFNRLLSNLVNNAVEVLGESGRVTISLGQNSGLSVV